MFAKETPLSAANGIGVPEHDTEGRVITLEYPGFYLVTVYTPNSQQELARLDYRMAWEEAFLTYLKGSRREKTRRRLRGHERCPLRNRPEKSEGKRP